MIKLTRVTKYYPTPNGRKYILKDVSLDIPGGKNIGVFGRNGTGKSTLLRLLGKIDYPNQGRIEVKGSLSWPMGLSGGYQGSLSGRDNASFVCRIYGDNENEVAEKVAFVHEFSELADYFDMPVNSYSSGMRSRLSFAVSMAFDFDYYLIDELTAVGDAQFKKKSQQALEEKKGRANVIHVSHNPGQLKKQCDIGIFLHEGKLHCYENMDEAIAAYQKA